MPIIMTLWEIPRIIIDKKTSTANSLWTTSTNLLKIMKTTEKAQRRCVRCLSMNYNIASLSCLREKEDQISRSKMLRKTLTIMNTRVQTRKPIPMDKRSAKKMITRNNLKMSSQKNLMKNNMFKTLKKNKKMKKRKWKWKKWKKSRKWKKFRK